MILSIAGIVMEELKSGIIPINPTIIRVMRVLRIARVLKLLKMAKGIRALLDTVGDALPQVGNLGLLFFLLFFIFAALGVELFGRLECSDAHPCDGLGEHAHFKSFGIAFLTLFRIATGDNWNGIMKDTLRDDCDSSDHCVTNCCVSPIIAPIFFVVFVLMSQVSRSYLCPISTKSQGFVRARLNCGTSSGCPSEGCRFGSFKQIFELWVPRMLVRPERCFRLQVCKQFASVKSIPSR